MEYCKVSDALNIENHFSNFTEDTLYPVFMNIGQYIYRGDNS